MPTLPASGPKVNVPGPLGVPASADPSALVRVPGTFRPSPVAIGQAADASGLAARVSAQTGLTTPVTKDLKDVSGSRIQRFLSEPAVEPGTLDDSAAQAAVLAATMAVPLNPLPVAVLPDSESEVSPDAEMADDSVALPDSSDDLVAQEDSSEAVVPAQNEDGSDPIEPARFEPTLAALRRAPFGAGFAADQQHGFSAVNSFEADDGSALPRPFLTETKGVPIPAGLDGRAVREIASGRVFADASAAGVNGLATAQALSAPKSRENGRGHGPVDPAGLHQAKFAEAGFVAMGESGRLENPVDKTFLSVQGKEVADVEVSLGTAVANPQSAMFSLTNGTQSPTVSDQLVGVVSVKSEVRATAEQTALPEQTVSSAQEAVDTVLDAADRMQSRDQRSVNLDFTVGDAKLAVRVELQGGEVRTTFRTESPELRVALAHEWEAVAGGNEERAFRLAPPTITGTDTPGRQDSFSDASSRQQERQQERESREALNVRDPAAENRARSGTPSSTMPAPRAPQFPSGTAQHLHHFA